MAKERYEDLIFQLGDLARVRLENARNPPRSLERVFRAEDTLVVRRQEIEDLEAQMNEEDAAFQDFCAQSEADREENLQIVKRWKKLVDTVDAKAKGLRKKLAQARSDVRFGEAQVSSADKRHAAFEQSGADATRTEQSRQNLKKLRMQHMRQAKALGEIELEFNRAFEVPETQPGAEGVRAHRANIELEDELARRKQEQEQRMEELNQAIAAKEGEVAAAQDFLDKAVFLLGEECYSQRIADRDLSPFYERLDRAQ